MSTVDILAIAAAVAGVLMAIAPTLQVRRMRRTRSSNDVSVLYLSMLDVGFVLWLAYGLALGNFAMIISNMASLTFMTLTISVALWFRRGGVHSGAPGSPVGELEASAPEG
jgi:MtN3 and saliva related transmembrane protein